MKLWGWSSDTVQNTEQKKQILVVKVKAIQIRKENVW